MKTAFDRRKLPAIPSAGRIVTIGVFDGVHLGHQALLAETVHQARATGAEAAVLTFRRHPRTLLGGEGPPTITSLEHRLLLLEKCGVDLVVALPFDEELRSTDAQAFLTDLLRTEMGARALVLGHDARFGKDRAGDASFARSRGWKVTVLEPVLVNGARVSSGAVRAAIAEGRLEDAARMLGRRPSLLGTVVHGDGRGRELGFATANLDLHHELEPPRGVYAAAVTLEGSRRAAVVNLGIRPTFGGVRRSVEVHIPGWSRDLYGERLEVELLTLLRGEQKFPSIEELKLQIARDTAAAVALFSNG